MSNTWDDLVYFSVRDKIQNYWQLNCVKWCEFNNISYQKICCSVKCSDAIQELWNFGLLRLIKAATLAPGGKKQVHKDQTKCQWVTFNITVPTRPQTIVSIYRVNCWSKMHQNCIKFLWFHPKQACLQIFITANNFIPTKLLTVYHLWT